MKIEIDIPELDEKEWEYLGVVPTKKGDMYYDCGSLSEWTLRQVSCFPHPTFRRRKSWKEGIVWPKLFNPGFIGKSEEGAVYWQPVGAAFRHYFWDKDHKVLDLSFLPKEFWECDWKDSLCEVAHK